MRDGGKVRERESRRGSSGQGPGRCPGWTRAEEAGLERWGRGPLAKAAAMAGDVTTAPSGWPLPIGCVCARVLVCATSAGTKI